MKRSSSLVAYSDSDESVADAAQSESSRLKRKRRLPKVSSALTVPVPVSDPAQHQGRIRTAAHVEGQFAAFVYIPVPLPNQSPLRALLKEAVHITKDSEPALQSEWLEDPNRVRELHVSLTRPLYLRDYQREELRRAVKTAARAHEPFIASFSLFSVLDNEERTRTFLTTEIGAGHSEMKRLSESLEPTLRLLHQEKFYTDPRFHASVAWALLSPPTNCSKESTTYGFVASESECSSNVAFNSISSIAPSLVSKLNDSLSVKLSTGMAGIFEADTICVKIGREVFSWNLGSG